MKALCIFLVIYAHVLYNSYKCSPIASIHDVFVNFFVALFFFTSGIFAYKTQKITGSDLGRIINIKTIQLLIPTLVFGTIYSYWSGGIENIEGIFLAPLKNGYWFTFVLFVFFVIYQCSTFIIKKIKHNWLILSITAFAVYALSIYSQKHPSVLFNVLSVPLWSYYLYFVLGAYCKCKLEKLLSLIDNKWFPTIITLLFFTFALFKKELHAIPNFPLQGTILQVSYSSICILMVFMFFRKLEKWFDNDERFVTRSINTIGRRTLDIYMIHYFFIPGDLSGIANFLTKSDSVVIDFMVTSIIVLGIVFFSLLISELLRLSHILSHFLLAQKKK